MTAVKTLADFPAHQRELGQLLLRLLKPIVGRLRCLESGGGSKTVHLLNTQTADDVFKDIVTRAEFVELLGQVQRLALLVGEIEKRKGFVYMGSWEPDCQYHRDDFCSHDGSMWACVATTMTKPGTSED